MKVLHATLMLTYSPGIYNQINSEQKSATTQGLDFDSIIFCPLGEYPESSIVKFSDFKSSNNIFFKAINWVKLRRDFYYWLFEQEKKYDIILLRYSVHDIFLLNFLRKKSKPVYLVHHTLELPELNSLGLIGKLRGLADKIIGSKCINQATGVIGVTREIVEFEKSRTKNTDINTYVYPNGIRMHNYHTLPRKAKTSEVIQILFVASVFSEWHGLDLLLNELKKSKSDFILHIIGEINDNQLSLINNDARVIVHGTLPKSKIEDIAKECSVGLSSFALFRKGMSEACTLKVREYLSLGLPVYSGHTDIFPEKFKYYRVGPPNFEEILKFCAEIKDVDRKEIRNSARPYIDKDITLSNLVKYLKGQHNTPSETYI